MIGAAPRLLFARDSAACWACCGRQQRQPRSAGALNTLLWTFNPLRRPLLCGFFSSDCTAGIRRVLTTPAGGLLSCAFPARRSRPAQRAARRGRACPPRPLACAAPQLQARSGLLLLLPLLGCKHSREHRSVCLCGFATRYCRSAHPYFLFLPPSFRPPAACPTCCTITTTAQTATHKCWRQRRPPPAPAPAEAAQHSAAQPPQPWGPALEQQLRSCTAQKRVHSTNLGTVFPLSRLPTSPAAPSPAPQGPSSFHVHAPTAEHNNRTQP